MTTNETGTQASDAKQAYVAIHRRCNTLTLPTMSGIFVDNPNLPGHLRRLLDPSKGQGSLIVVSGCAGNGKTTLVRTVIEDLLSSYSADNPLPLAHIGFQEYLYPEGAAARYIDEGETCLNNPIFQERIAVFDELRTPKGAFEAMALASGGVKVIAVLHATGPGQAIDRLRALLRSFGAGESHLDGLIRADRMISIWQEFL